MENKNLSTKEKIDATMKTVSETAKSKNGKIVGIVILVIILLNTFWSMMESKMTSELQAVKADLAALNTRVTEMEKGTINLDAVKADIESIKGASANFEAKLNAVVKAEESRQEVLAKDLESHKAYIEELKSLLAGETGK